MKQIESFTYQNVRYFLPTSPPVLGDSETPFTAEKANFLLALCDVRPIHTAYVSVSEPTVDYVA